MPDGDARLRLLVVAPYLNGEGLGEVYSIYKLIEALSRQVELTVLVVNGGQHDVVAQLPYARVVMFREPAILHRRFRQLNISAKPWIPVFFAQARRWIATELAKGATWDILHQALPQAMRYPAPWHRLGLPYVIGPLGGSLETPAAFVDEVGGGRGYTRLRALDHWRLRHDPSLRRGYARADLILGVAPYIGDTLQAAGVEVARFEPILERAHEGAFPDVTRTSGVGEAHILHVGRGVRTKGLRDVVRAMAHLKDLPGVRLTSAGDGPEIAPARAEAAALGVSDRVTFLGRIPRDEVDRLYAEADVFCFPSFREPMGGVFFEAMEYGLPVIAAARGGPDFILDEACALKLPVETPDQFQRDIAGAIRTLAMDPERRRHMGTAALKRLEAFGSWDERATRMVALYREICLS